MHSFKCPLQAAWPTLPVSFSVCEQQPDPKRSRHSTFSKIMELSENRSNKNWILLNEGQLTDKGELRVQALESSNFCLV